jgi:hypothetical protein
MKPGRSLEKLVAYLEKHLASSGAVLVESPKRIVDKTTGRLREHDVVLTVTSGHHTIMVAVECRDRSRPVGVPQIEGFAKKCSETFINKAVIVSPCGFTSTALIKAKALGIKCLSLEQVDSLPWLFSDFKFKQIKTEYKHFDFTIIPKENFTEKPINFDLVVENDEVISIHDLRNTIINAMNARENDPNETQVGDKVEKLNVVVPNLAIVDKKTGHKKNIEYIETTAYSETQIEEIPFVLQEYKEATSDSLISQLAVAKVDFGFAKGRFVINHKLETGGEIVFISDTDKSNKFMEPDIE